MKTHTQSFVTHRTTLISEGKRSDGGRSLLLEAFDLIHREKQTGKLTVHFGVGGSISSAIFEETEVIPQRDIKVV